MRSSSVRTKRTRIGTFLLILVIVIAAGGGAFVWNAMQPVSRQEQAVDFTIDKGMGTAAIADRLQEKGLIKNALVFKAYLKWKQAGGNFQAGTYAVQPGATFTEIINKLSAGDVVKPDMIKFTIPEGYTIVQIADKLQAEGIADKQTFLKLANDPASFHSPLLAGIPADAKLRYKLEGYLFPETYELPKGSTVQEIIQRMLDQLQKELDPIPDLQALLDQRELTMHQALTMASLVEREVVADKERPLVAGVINNRLQRGMKLEIDATVQYLLYKQKERLLYRDLEVESPYNTYKYKGLPPGPIANPSLESVKAVLDPEKSDYLFYVTKKDGSQEHLFAKTYQEHLKNIEKSKQMSK
ncbi:endolytic transglycosylase MltG [Paenibacillus sp. JX-17]|uniref:Endolytic murein transglycosylase n=1 Tax=Paenibacillus lacisoli TaxID=3064525 RepID=A0ABT9CFR8_9BACL|nr:endolytic transglycosylase MltG [Paenibacillus sp. JX-17]MDO7908120.1 endolytic transglycosylase MltG [Paenibacillus sp. JX-17]